MLAYHDTFAGLVPCRILAVGDWSDSRSHAVVKYTATRGAYRRGEQQCVTLGSLVPRTAVYRRNYMYRIRPFTWPKA